MVRLVRADTMEFQDLSENEGMSWGQAVTPDGKEKDYTSKEQGEVLNFVLQRKDVSKVQASQNKTKQSSSTTTKQNPASFHRWTKHQKPLEKYQSRAMYPFYQTQED